MKSSRILIVDDEKLVCKGLKKEFSEAGFNADCAANGEEAIECFKKNEYDLVFLDLVLPEADGVKTCKELKSINPRAKIVLMTGMLEKDPILKEVEFEQAGGQIEYLYKPFSEGEVLEIAKKILK